MTINTKLEPAAAAVARDNNNDDDDAAAETYCNSSHHDAIEKACCNNNKNSSIHAVTAIKSPAQKQASETYINENKTTQFMHRFAFFFVARMQAQANPTENFMLATLQMGIRIFQHTKAKKRQKYKINDRSRSKNKEDFNVRRLARIENLQSWEVDRRRKSWQQLQHGSVCSHAKDVRT
jgi:hypothetical protein